MLLSLFLSANFSVNARQYRLWRCDCYPLSSINAHVVMYYIDALYWRLPGVTAAMSASYFWM
ncbi:hypothetical protein SIN8267_01192 [Sinobacterium norvegicum]|uniref:Uncharacterized protein n=1 Tax=Sinobacterium norvegicum TaxID=1641715 RepID=A0ABM9AD15_9GAMM|nr:hypothetical protein SIN8267_01192 [Sinobacterium norvegicum]